jgi:serine-type D-Ala-D-Ala carboxypeptidase/endopeptidase (penicillin-binding protein 4)
MYERAPAKTQFILADKFQRLRLNHGGIVICEGKTARAKCRFAVAGFYAARYAENLRMKMKITFFCAAGFLLLTFSAHAQPTNFAKSLPELRAQLDALLNQPRFSGALWGVKIVSLATGKTLYENHADRLMSPASNSKLYSSALALETFGGDYRFATPVFATTNVDESGTVHGDLIISGRGDPSWKAANFSENFAPFVALLTNAGIRRVSGDLGADATFFHGPPFGSSWCVDDLDDSDGAEISALTLDDNTAQIRVTPGMNVGDACAVTMVQPETGIILVNRTRTIAGGESDLKMVKQPGGQTVCILGEMPVGAKSEILDVPVPEPAVWFGGALKNALVQNGISVDGKVSAVAWPETPAWNETNLIKIGEVKSPPLREIIAAFLKPSQNLETDLVFDNVGEFFRTTNSPAWETSEELAVAALGHFLKSNGIPADVHFDEGSGLSRNNLTSADATVALLAMMAKSRSAQDYFDALPVAGVDGTLRRRMKKTPAFKNVHAKTGTLRWANSLSGYVTTAAGEKLAFSLMLNRCTSENRTEELDDIAVLLAGFTGRSDE